MEDGARSRKAASSGAGSAALESGKPDTRAETRIQRLQDHLTGVWSAWTLYTLGAASVIAGVLSVTWSVSASKAGLCTAPKASEALFAVTVAASSVMLVVLSLAASNACSKAEAALARAELQMRGGAAASAVTFEDAVAQCRGTTYAATACIGGGLVSAAGTAVSIVMASSLATCNVFVLIAAATLVSANGLLSIVATSIIVTRAMSARSRARASSPAAAAKPEGEPLLAEASTASAADGSGGDAAQAGTESRTCGLFASEEAPAPAPRPASPAPEPEVAEWSRPRGDMGAAAASASAAARGAEASDPYLAAALRVDATDTDAAVEALERGGAHATAAPAEV